MITPDPRNSDRSNLTLVIVDHDLRNQIIPEAYSEPKIFSDSLPMDCIYEINFRPERNLRPRRCSNQGASFRIQPFIVAGENSGLN